MHPQAQRELFSSLVNLSKDESQVILCTHSSSFLDLEHHKSICIVKKENIVDGTKVLQYVNDIFEGSEEIKSFNLSYWINPERSELFFAKKVILVEGQTDKTIFPFIAKRLNIFKYDYTIIDCGGKDSIHLYISLLNKFKINYIVVYDKDNHIEKSPQKIADSNAKNLIIENAIDINFGKSILLENDIEEEIGLRSSGGRNKAHKALSYVVSNEFVLSESLENKIKIIFG